MRAVQHEAGARLSPGICIAAMALSLVACAPMPVTSAAQERAGGIELTLTNSLPFARRAEPITCGVPLVRGFVSRPDDLALLGPNGRAVPVQVLVTGKYADGSPRWVLLDFQADLPAGGTAVYRLVKGRRPRVRERLTYKTVGDVAEIDTGAAQFRVDIKSFRLFDSVIVGGAQLVAGPGGGAFLEEEGKDRPHSGVKVTKVEFEDAGPMRVVLAVRGQIKPGGKLPLANYVCRMHFYAGKSEVRVFYTLHNPAAHRHPGNIWDLGQGGSVLMEDFALVVPLARQGRWTSRVGVEVDKPAVEPASKLYQDSSGGVNWNSVNHVDKDYKVPTSFRGYQVFKGSEKVAAGHRADGWLHARGTGGGAAVGVRDFWQNFPKALEFADGRFRIGLWPREFAGVHELLGGEQKTHEMLFVFHGAKTGDDLIERRMKAFQRPLYAMPDPEAVYASRAFWPAAPLDRERHKMLERTCDTFVYPRGERKDSVMTKWEQIDEFGWRHFGDTFADNEFSPAQMVKDHPKHHFGRQPISHYVNEYSVIYGVMLQGLRRHDPRWLWLADVMARHFADICIYHTGAEGPKSAYGHGPFMHTTHDTAAYRSTHRTYPIEAQKYKLRYGSGGGPNPGHTYVISLAQHYYLTGDRVSREAFLEAAGWTINSRWSNRKRGDKRGVGNFMITQVYAYQLTWERKYYDAAMVELKNMPSEPFSRGMAPTLFVKAAAGFLDMKITNDQLDDDYRKVRAKMLLFGDHFLTLDDAKTKRYLEQACLFVELLATCYLYAPDDHPNREKYFARAKQIMEAAKPRWPGSYRPTKTLIMCFSNTGAYFKAERARQEEGRQ